MPSSILVLQLLGEDIIVHGSSGSLGDVTTLARLGAMYTWSSSALPDKARLPAIDHLEGFPLVVPAYTDRSSCRFGPVEPFSQYGCMWERPTGMACDSYPSAAGLVDA